MAWIAIKDQEPPEHAPVIFGWWCYWPDSISWEYSTDRPDCATHWCRLPNEPKPDQALIQPGARAPR